MIDRSGALGVLAELLARDPDEVRAGYARRIAEHEAAADRRREREWEEFLRSQEAKYGRGERR